MLVGREIGEMSDNSDPVNLYVLAINVYKVHKFFIFTRLDKLFFYLSILFVELHVCVCKYNKNVYFSTNNYLSCYVLYD